MKRLSNNLFSTLLKGFACLFLVMASALGSYAQNQLSGTVTDAATGLPLPGASVRLADGQKGSITNAQGSYRLAGLADGSYTLVVSFVGYAAAEQTLVLEGDDAKANFSLAEIGRQIGQSVVYALRDYPLTTTTVEKATLEKMNLGQDLPALLNFQPSVVYTSDAGAGVGYTGIRIRGSDPQRVNVTINGIPLNDSESHGVFWVNMPDFATSVGSINIQRGVGTSVNGAGAFGGSINIDTEQPKQEAFTQIDNSFGSFNTWRHNVQFGSGTLGDKFSVQGRLSKISSDGFIDRSGSDLRSFFISGQYKEEKSALTLNIFSGQEQTQQAWWGVPEARLRGDVEGMQQYISNNGLTEAQAENLLNSNNRTYNHYIYDNEIDNYQQDHYQLLYNRQLGSQWNLHLAGHYTRGRGYFEQARYGSRLSSYGLASAMVDGELVERTDLVVKRWLDNHYGGGIFNLNYQSKNRQNGSPTLDFVLGGGANRYIGDHYGEVIWSRLMTEADKDQRYYEGQGRKTDMNLYAKGNYQLLPGLFLFADLQIRTVDYAIDGIDNNLRDVTTRDEMVFFNPKTGLRYQFGSNELYGTFAIANKEPNRRDYTDALPGQSPEHETLRNLEVGYARNMGRARFSVNYYLMDYKNQLVPTGEVNDVGGAIRRNIANSYRTGLELEWQVLLGDKIRWNANATFSQNRNRNYTEFVIDYADFTYATNNLGDTDIALSPNTIAGSQLSYELFNGLEIALQSKYVGDQFLDNTSSKQRKIDAFFVNDLRFNYRFKPRHFKEVGVNLLINNILDVAYESNGYTYAYAFMANTVRENHYYPQAGINFLLGLSIKM